MKFSPVVPFHTPNVSGTLFFIAVWAGLGLIGGGSLTAYSLATVACAGLAIGVTSCWAYRKSISKSDIVFDGWITKELMALSWQGQVLGYNAEVRLLVAVVLSLISNMPEVLSIWAGIGVVHHLCLLLLIVLPDFWSKHAK